MAARRPDLIALAISALAAAVSIACAFSHARAGLAAVAGAEPAAVQRALDSQ